MLRTKNDLAERALRVLGAVASGQDPGAEDMQLAVGMVPSVLSELELYGLAEQDQAQFDEPQFLPLANCLAFALAPEFGVTGAELQGLDALRERAEGRLKALANLDSGGPVEFLTY